MNRREGRSDATMITYTIIHREAMLGGRIGSVHVACAIISTQSENKLLLRR